MYDKNKLEVIKKNISITEGLEQSKEIIDSLEYILKLEDESIYPFIMYQQSVVHYWIHKHKELNILYNALILSFSFNIIFLIYYIVKSIV
jgi:hypothetical protein